MKKRLRAVLDDLVFGDPVRIEWVDANSCEEGWTPVRDISSEVRRIISIGSLIRVTDEVVTIALDLDLDGGNASSAGSIPIINVVSVERLHAVS